jgi:hypothetical protein
VPHTVVELAQVAEGLRSFVDTVDLTSLEERPRLLEYRGPTTADPDHNEMLLAGLGQVSEEATATLGRRQRQASADGDSLVALETIVELAGRLANMPASDRFVVCGDHGARMHRVAQLPESELDELVADMKLLLQEYPTRVSTA